ncbi:MAG: hypothetical protein N2490_09340 [Ignavibacteria bacterium]|nr:hypothetical protein [Ignavibacteria bacterium]
MKKQFIFFILLMVLLPLTFGFPQLRFEGGINGGITIPTGDYSGTMADFYSGTKYGLSTGFNIGGYASLVTPILSGRISLNYSHLKNDGNPPPSEGGGTIELNHNILTIGIGPQYNIPLPASPIKPFLVAELLIVSISGETNFKGVSSVPSGTYKIPSATRLGFGITGGFNYDFGMYGISVQAKYNLLNLAGKEFKSDDPTKRLSSYTNLNDEKDILYAPGSNIHIIGTSRNISTIQLNLGFNFSLGF